jgi:hypothetical protein
MNRKTSDVRSCALSCEDAGRVLEMNDVIVSNESRTALLNIHLNSLQSGKCKYRQL